MASSSNSETKDSMLRSMKDIIFTGITNLSLIGSKLNEDNVESVLSELKILTDKLNSSLEIKTKSIVKTEGKLEIKDDVFNSDPPIENVTDEVTVIISNRKYIFEFVDDILYVNGKQKNINISYLDRLVTLKSLGELDIDCFNDLFLFSKRIKGMVTAIPVVVYVCHSLMHKKDLRYNFFIKYDNDKVETVYIGGKSIVDPYVVYGNRNINCLAMKNWIDEKLKSK